VSEPHETSATILIADDEPRYVRWITLNLRASGYQVLSTGDGQAALELTARERPDLVLLDLGLPGLDGLEVCRRIREFSTVPIVMLTARAAESDKVAGLDAGADDYLTKPFGPPELLARVRAALRRGRYAEAPTSEPVFRQAELTIDYTSCEVRRGGEPIALTPTEYRLLVCLARNAGRVLLPEQLLTAVWGPEYRDETQHVRLYVSRLRRKIERDPERPRYVLTKPGIGYLFVAGEPPDRAGEADGGAGASRA
jgi:DNA-binding response OmpR family regulator